MRFCSSLARAETARLGDPWLISLLILWMLPLLYGWRAGAGRETAAPPPTALSTLDPNTAPWWELTVLPGIGEHRARAIVAYREAAEDVTLTAFRSANDLAQVRGIGPRTVERIRPHLRFPSDAGHD